MTRDMHKRGLHSIAMEADERVYMQVNKVHLLLWCMCMYELLNVLTGGREKKFLFLLSQKVNQCRMIFGNSNKVILRIILIEF